MCKRNSGQELGATACLVNLPIFLFGHVRLARPENSLLKGKKGGKGYGMAKLCFIMRVLKYVWFKQKVDLDLADARHANQKWAIPMFRKAGAGIVKGDCEIGEKMFWQVGHSLAMCNADND